MPVQDQDNVYNPLSYDKRQKCTKNTSSGDDGDDVVTGLRPYASRTPFVYPLGSSSPSSKRLVPRIK